MPSPAFANFAAHHMDAALFQAVEGHDVRRIAALAGKTPAQTIREADGRMKIYDIEFAAMFCDLLAESQGENEFGKSGGYLLAVDQIFLKEMANRVAAALKFATEVIDHGGGTAFAASWNAARHQDAQGARSHRCLQSPVLSMWG